MGADLLDFGLDYLRRYGWSVIFVRGKEAACKWTAYQSRRPTEKELHRMFERRDLTGLAVVLSGDLWARDFDEAEAYPRWAASFPDLACKAPTVETARGFHVYGCWPGVTFAALEDGELRAGGGCYNLLPPSRHPTGHVYTWSIPPGESIPRLDPGAAGLARPWCPDTTEPPPEQRDRESESRRDGDSEEVGERTDGGPETTTLLTLAEVIRRALPDSVHQNHAKLFLLARGVKTLERTNGREWSMRELETKAFAPWYEQNRHLRPEQTREQYLAEFLLGFDLVRHPLGEGVMEETWAKAETLEPPPVARQFASPHLQRVVTWCYLLQLAAGDAPFFLSVRTLQGKLGLGSPQRASAILRRLVDAGILTEVAKGGRDTNRATRFRFVAVA